MVDEFVIVKACNAGLFIAIVTYNVARFGKMKIVQIRYQYFHVSWICGDAIHDHYTGSNPRFAAYTATGYFFAGESGVETTFHHE